MTNRTDKSRKTLSALTRKVGAWWRYVSKGVWSDQRNNWRINAIKTANLSVRSFFNADLQTQACAMAFRTLLALVPALALLFAIAGGFGLSEFLESELYRIIPSQREALQYALQFIDSYLKSYSEGWFVGIGLLFLLWTLISLFSSIEDTFNLIWGIKDGRSYGRKITDYTAMLLILPVVMMCAGGLNIMVSSTLRSLIHWQFMTPIITVLLEGLSWLFTWMFFGLLYLLMPNTRVRVGHALIAGVFAGTGFMILQWIFVTGQMYVSRYNAIYGSFSFLPLLLIWTQLTWVIVFAGAVICYSSQNIYMYNFSDAIENMSPGFYAQLVLAICAVVVQRFVDGRGATTTSFLVKNYKLPPRLCNMLCDKLVKAGILSVTIIDPHRDIKGFQPALDPSQLTVDKVFSTLNNLGTTDFVPDFKQNFPGVVSEYSMIYAAQQRITQQTLLSEINIKHLTQK